MLTLADVKLVLDDLLTKRHAALAKSQSGKLAEPELEDLRNQIDALPRVLTTATPLAEELAAADDVHDESGRVLYYATEVVLHDKGASPEAVAAAKMVRAAFIPALDELNAPLPDEATRARERRPLLSDKTIKASLGLLPLTDGRTTFDAATRMLDAGDLIDSLLSDRSDITRPDRSAASVLRPKAIGALNDFRKNLRKEVARNTKLPRDLEAQVFGYFDLLSSYRTTTKKGPAPPPPETPPKASD